MCPHAHIRSRGAGFAQPARSAGAKRCFANSPPNPPTGAEASLGAALRETF
ncbi:Uncharacterized protein pbN1_28320 [Aromatoleum bremense]|nr:Uncharacterized protein pbN1_28320 [Aromatoleum bremense]